MVPEIWSLVASYCVQREMSILESMGVRIRYLFAYEGAHVRARHLLEVYCNPHLFMGIGFGSDAKNLCVFTGYFLSDALCCKNLRILKVQSIYNMDALIRNLKHLQVLHCTLEDDSPSSLTSNSLVELKFFSPNPRDPVHIDTRNLRVLKTSNNFKCTSTRLERVSFRGYLSDAQFESKQLKKLTCSVSSTACMNILENTHFEQLNLHCHMQVTSVAILRKIRKIYCSSRTLPLYYNSPLQSLMCTQDTFELFYLPKTWSLQKISLSFVTLTARALELLDCTYIDLYDCVIENNEVPTMKKVRHLSCLSTSLVTANMESLERLKLSTCTSAEQCSAPNLKSIRIRTIKADTFFPLESVECFDIDMDARLPPHVKSLEYTYKGELYLNESHLERIVVYDASFAESLQHVQGFSISSVPFKLYSKRHAKKGPEYTFICAPTALELVQI